MPERRLYRSNTNRILGGVCGGLGNYFDIDPVLIRLIFVLLASVGAGVIIYLIAWIIIPEERALDKKSQDNENKKGIDSEEISDRVHEVASEIRRHARSFRRNHNDNEGRLIAGVIIIALGVIFLLQNVFRVNVFSNLWPIILIIIGLVFLTGSSKR